MKERCPSCGNEIYPNSKYCGNCGKEIKKENPIPVVNETNNQEVITNEQIYNNAEQTNNKDAEQLKTISLVFSLLGLFFSLILSIVGLITGIVYSSKTKKTCAGLVISIISIVLKVLIIVLATALVVAFGTEFADEMSKHDYNYGNYDYNEQYNNNYNYYEENNNQKIDKQTIGNDQYGYVKVPKDWIKFFDPDAKDTVQYSYMMTYIVTLYAYDSSITDPYLIANNLKKNEEQSGLSVNMTQTTIDKYNAYKLEYIIDGTWLNIYFFKAEDNRVHYICIEGPDKNSEYFNIPKTFKLRNTEV